MNHEARKAQQRQAAALGQAAAQARLAGRSPVEVGRERLNAALQLIYDWGFTAPRLLDEHLHNGRSGYAHHLVKMRLLESRPLPGVGRFLDLPASMVVLTPQGVEWVEAQIDTPMHYDPENVIHHHQIRHKVVLLLC